RRAGRCTPVCVCGSDLARPARYDGVMLLHVLGIVCGLAVVVLAALEPRRLDTGLAFCAGLVAAAIVIGATHVPDPVWGAALTAAGAAVALWTPRAAWMAFACGGVLAAVWASVLAAQGLAVPVAYALVTVVAAASSGLAAFRPRFAPSSLREEALVLVAALALLVAAAPAGRHPAATLRGSPLEPPATASAAWAFALAGCALVCGAIHALWRRR